MTADSRPIVLEVRGLSRRFGAFVAQSSIETMNTADALEQLLLELRAIAAGKPEQITPEELERSKSDLVHQLGGHLEHVRTVLADTAELYVDRLPADYRPSSTHTTIAAHSTDAITSTTRNAGCCVLWRKTRRPAHAPTTPPMSASP